MTSWLLLFACSPDLEEGVHLREALAHTVRAGALQVVPPVALPLPAEDARVEVWLSGPEEAGLRLGPNGNILAYAPGTIADRVEFRGERVVDVRGTRIDADGKRWHHVYKTLPGQAELMGASWPADDPDATERAIDQLMASLADHGNRHTVSIRKKLDCNSCHTLDRPANHRQRERGLVNRGTDGAGFFTPVTLLMDRVPLETYGTDPNLHNPFILTACPEGLPQRTATATRCAHTGVATAQLDLASALAAHDPAAEAFVTSRDALLARAVTP
jgi:hypothetical protein